MFSTETKSNNKRLIAAVAVLALIVCAFVAFVPSDASDADTTVEKSPTIASSNQISADRTITAEGNYYLSANATVTLDAEVSVTLYVAPGVTATIAGSQAAKITVIPATEKIASDNTVSFYDGLSIVAATGGKYTNNNGNLATSATLGTGSVYGVSVIGSTGADVTYYPTGADVTADLKTTDAKVAICNGSATINTYDGMTETAKLVSTIRAVGVVASTPTEIAWAVNGVPTIANAWTSGTVSITDGKATVSAGLTGITGNLLNAFATADVTTGTDVTIAAAVEDLGTLENLYIYGTVASNQTASMTTGTINMVDANVTSLNVIGSENASIGSFTVAGDLVLTVSSGKLTFEATTSLISTDVTLVSGTFVSGTTSVTIDENSSLTIASGATLEMGAYAEDAFVVKGDMNVSGTIKYTGADTGTAYITVEAVTEGNPEDLYTGAFRAFSGAKIPGNVIATGNGTIDFSGMSGTRYVYGVTVGDETYYQSQTVEVVDYYDVDNNSTITIYGSLIIPENTTMTIREGSKVVVDGAASAIEIRGELIVEEGAYFTVDAAKNVDVYKTISSEGVLTLNGKVEIKNGGTITSSGSIITDTDSELTVATGGSLSILGEFTIEKITNKGAITLNEAVMKTNSTITLDADGASVDIVSFTSTVSTSGTLTVQDKLATADKITLTVTEQNTGYSGIEITESITKDEDRNDVYKIDISGTIENVDETVDGEATFANNEVEASGTGVTVTGDLTLGENTTFNVAASSKLTVSGTITATADGSEIATNGVIDVIGMIQTGNNSKLENVNSPASVNAAFYKVQNESKVTTKYFTTLKAAVDNGATSIEVLGTVVVKEDIPVPTGVTVENSGTLTIGDSDNRGITVSFADGAVLRGNQVTVNATMEFENNKNCRATVVSDVRIDNDPAVTYTNVYTALNNAGEGDVITITSEAGVVIDADITIKEGVTLSVPAGRSISVVDNVTITVDGTMTSYSGIAGDFAVKESETAAALVVNGVYMTGQSGTIDDIYDDYKTAGTYYFITDEQGSYTYIAPLETAAAAIQDAEVAYVYGENTAGDVTITGTEDEPVGIIVMDAATLKTGTVTLSYAAFIVEDARYDGTVATDLGTVQVVNTKNIGFGTVEDADEVMHFAVTGTPAQKDTSRTAPKSSVTVATGTVDVIEEPLDVTGTSFGISTGATLNVIDEMTAANLTVTGTLSVDNGGVLEVTGAMYVVGAFTVAEADTQENLPAGTASVVTMYVGFDSEFVATDGTANVAAPTIADLETVYLAAASTVGQDILDEFELVTEFLVEGELYMTVYTSETVAISEIAAPEMNGAAILCWQYDDNGTLRDITAANEKNVGDEEQVSAKMKYDVYKVQIKVDAGFSDIYIDGDLVATDGISYSGNDFVYLTAGQHTVTYKLNNGWSGEIKVTFDGTEAVDGKFTIDAGTPFVEDGKEYVSSGANSIVYQLVVTGAEATGYDTPGSASSSGSDGMGLTDYLLIILVVLIVVMAIMVALRLMRS